MNSSIRRLAVAVVATVASATLFVFGTGLTPTPWLTWLAPLPVLLLALRVRARVAFLAASAAWLGGETPMWGYFLNTVQIPPPMVVSIVIGSALLFGLVVLLARGLIRQGRPLLAVAATPAAWVVIEYAMSVLSPNGAWWSLAYTQADILAVLQAAAVTGPWGITFLLLGVPTAVAALLAPQAAGRARVAVAAGLILALTAGYGVWRLHTPGGGGSEQVALLATDRLSDPTPVDTPEGRNLLAEYGTHITEVAARGARVVVMPEKVFAADDTTLPVLATPLARLAADHGVDVIVGLVLEQHGALRNAAIDFPADGGRPVVYFKHHLISGLEGDFAPGDQPAFVADSGTRWGIAICFDLDLPGLVRDYRRRGATTLFVPAWDFNQDAWLHGRMAVTRGVESGLTVARAARNGDLVVSDAHGRIVAEAHSADAPFVSLVTTFPDSPAPTMYAKFGDWFAWACMVLLLIGLILVNRSLKGRRNAQRGAVRAGLPGRRGGGTRRGQLVHRL
ncbi:nitrilase-related carbon-nitrogen hydrolase [Actinoplanes sp. NPDC048791]|uniref:nitrilase-related carbon-nitrogen hydrolase n=1 Tax=Actinoplanes sp. NPDC048791 TaxID=3154623 RepID=UPI0033F1103B